MDEPQFVCYWCGQIVCDDPDVCEDEVREQIAEERA